MMTAAAERGMLLNGLLAAMRLSAEPMVVTDPHQADNPIIASNRPFQELTLYSEAEMSGRNCRFLQGPRTDPHSVKMMGETIRRGEGFVQYLVNYRQDRTQFFNLLFVSPVTAHDGTLHFFFASQHDLSGRVPLDVSEFPLGPAHMPPAQQSEFRLLLLDIAHEVTLANASTAMPARVRALEAALTASREIAALAMKLQPGGHVAVSRR